MGKLSVWPNFWDWFWGNFETHFLFENGGLIILGFFWSGLGFFLDACFSAVPAFPAFPASLLFCFPASLLLCFSAFFAFLLLLLLCFSAFLLFCFSYFFASLLFSAFPAQSPLPLFCIKTQARKYISWGWHDDVVNMMVWMLTMTIVRSLHFCEPTFSWKLIALHVRRDACILLWGEALRPPPNPPSRFFILKPKLVNTLVGVGMMMWWTW